MECCHTCPDSVLFEVAFPDDVASHYIPSYQGAVSRVSCLPHLGTVDTISHVSSCPWSCRTVWERVAPWPVDPSQGISFKLLWIPVRLSQLWLLLYEVDFSYFTLHRRDLKLSVSSYLPLCLRWSV